MFHTSLKYFSTSPKSFYIKKKKKKNFLSVNLCIPNSQKILRKFKKILQKVEKYGGFLDKFWKCLWNVGENFRKFWVNYDKNLEKSGVKFAEILRKY